MSRAVSTGVCGRQTDSGPYGVPRWTGAVFWDHFGLVRTLNVRRCRCFEIRKRAYLLYGIEPGIFVLLERGKGREYPCLCDRKRAGNIRALEAEKSRSQQLKYPYAVGLGRVWFSRFRAGPFYISKWWLRAAAFDSLVCRLTGRVARCAHGAGADVRRCLQSRL